METGQKLMIMDTIGFISRLPHELVESFKATLSEIHGAELLVHIRDVSHPSTHMQRETVLTVLKEIIGFELQNPGSCRYIEVLNKIDLLNPEEAEKVIQKEREGTTFPVVAISATKGTNVEKLKEILITTVNQSTGKRVRVLGISYENSDKKLRWLRDNAHIFDDGIGYDEKSGMMKVRVIIDDLALQAYAKQFGRKNGN